MENLHSLRVKWYNQLFLFANLIRLDRARVRFVVSDKMFLQNPPGGIYVHHLLGFEKEVIVDKDLLLSDLLRVQIHPELTFKYNRKMREYEIDNQNLLF